MQYLNAGLFWTCTSTCWYITVLLYLWPLTFILRARPIRPSCSDVPSSRSTLWNDDWETDWRTGVQDWNGPLTTSSCSTEQVRQVRTRSFSDPVCQWHVFKRYLCLSSVQHVDGRRSETSDHVLIVREVRGHAAELCGQLERLTSGGGGSLKQRWRKHRTSLQVEMKKRSQWTLTSD